MSALDRNGNINFTLLKKEITQGLIDDRQYHLVDEMKKRAIHKATSYEEFQSFVSCAHLTPLQPGEMDELTHERQSTNTSKKYSSSGGDDGESVTDKYHKYKGQSSFQIQITRRQRDLKYQRNLSKLSHHSHNGNVKVEELLVKAVSLDEFERGWRKIDNYVFDVKNSSESEGEGGDLFVVDEGNTTSANLNAIAINNTLSQSLKQKTLYKYLKVTIPTDSDEKHIFHSEIDVTLLSSIIQLVKWRVEESVLQGFALNNSGDGDTTVDIENRYESSDDDDDDDDDDDEENDDGTAVSDTLPPLPSTTTIPMYLKTPFKILNLISKTPKFKFNVRFLDGNDHSNLRFIHNNVVLPVVGDIIDGKSQGVEGGDWEGLLKMFSIKEKVDDEGSVSVNAVDNNVKSKAKDKRGKKSNRSRGDDDGMD